MDDVERWRRRQPAAQTTASRHGRVRTSQFGRGPAGSAAAAADAASRRPGPGGHCPAGHWRPECRPEGHHPGGCRPAGPLPRLRVATARRRSRRAAPGKSPVRRHVPGPPGTRAGNRWSGGRSPRPRERRPAVPRPPGRFQHAFLLTPRGSMADSAVEPTGHSLPWSLYLRMPGAPRRANGNPSRYPGNICGFAFTRRIRREIPRLPPSCWLSRMIQGRDQRYPHRVAHLSCCFAALLTVATSVSGMGYEEATRLPVRSPLAIHQLFMTN